MLHLRFLDLEYFEIKKMLLISLDVKKL